MMQKKEPHQTAEIPDLYNNTLTLINFNCFLQSEIHNIKFIAVGSE